MCLKTEYIYKILLCFSIFIKTNITLMKKTLFLIILLAILIGCKSTTPIVNTKLDNKTEKILKGNWVITSVNYVGIDYIKVNSFNIAASNCFIGSNWNFVSNNNKGTMSLNNPDLDCNEFNSPIKWYVNKDSNFVLKIINNHKAKDVNKGYILKLSNITQNSFDLTDKINLAGQSKNITYTFQRK